MEPGKYVITPDVDDVISDYANNGINIVLGLNVGTGENRPDKTKFKSNEDIERYGNWVRFMVSHFRDRIRYYEIWNEPDTSGPSADIAWGNYVNLINHIIPIIREEDPNAKIVIGAIGGVEDWYRGEEDAELGLDYLENVLKSGIAPLVDVISWHPFYGTRPDDPYYQDYPQLVTKKIKEVAVSEGFEGEYLAEEIAWATWAEEGGVANVVSEGVATKYYARAILMHRGLNVTVTFQGKYLVITNLQNTIHNINTIMAGAEPVELPLVIESEAMNIKVYGFSLPNGDNLVALWTDGVGVDEDAGVSATLTLNGFSDQKVIGIDVLKGFQQPLMTNNENGNLAIQNLIVRDYPLILHIAKSSTEYPTK